MLNSQQWDHQQPGLQPQLCNQVIKVLGNLHSVHAGQDCHQQDCTVSAQRSARIMGTSNWTTA
eukprot:2416817-Prorocentrum_lima.AAC.1